MTTPIEEFTIALSKVSKRANRYLRGFGRADREDVIAQTLAWCWEHKEEFNPAEESLEWWWTRHLRPIAHRFRMKQDEHDGAQRAHVNLETLDVLSRHASGAPLPTSDSDTRPWLVLSRPPIDHEIEKLLSGPRVGMKDCPPCWRCMYFEGWTPNMSRYKVPTHVDPEIEQALREIERRKINIGFGRQPEENAK